MREVITELESDIVVERMPGKAEHILPGNRQLITFRTEICSVDLRRGRTIGRWKGDSRREHILCVTDVGVTCELQSVVQKRHIHSEVILDGCLPCEVGCDRSGNRGADRLVTTEQIALGSHRDGPQIGVVTADILIAELSVGISQFKIVKPAFQRLEEILLGDSPAGRGRRKEAPSVTRGETGGSVITATDLE